MENTKPDVIFFMVDQLAAKWFEAALDGASDLPNFRRLKENGTYFSNAISSNPVCCPSRATIATGMTTRVHGVLENGYQLDPGLPTFMKVLQDNGWHTGALGKVHFQPHFRGLRPDYKPYGYDVVHNTEDSRGGEWLDWVEENYPEHYESVLATIWTTKVPEFERYGPKEINLRERIEKIRSNFEWATADFPRNTYFASTMPFPEEASQTNWITMHAVNFIRGAAADIPICAQISYVQPHGPFHTFAEYMGKVELEKIPDPIPSEWFGDANAPEELKRRKPFDYGNHDVQYARHCYFADLVHLDKQLGIVIDTLRETGRLENAYIIFLSDHGDLLFDHGLLGKEEQHYDACIRVPIIVSGPGLNKNAVVEQFVQLEDICPTVMEMTDQHFPLMPKTGPYLKTEQKDIPILPGSSFLPLCRGDETHWGRKSAYIESYNSISKDHPGQWARTIRSHKYRYSYYPRNRDEQLFDLENDPDESMNLASDPRYDSARSKLKDDLMELIIMQDYPKTRRDLFSLGVH